MGKMPWVPGTDEALLKSHQTYLKKRIEFSDEFFAKPPSVDPAAAPNETRMMISAILEDEFKVDEDKLSDIQTLLKEGTVLENHLYKDATTGAFLICEHELERLRGEFAKNPRAYLQTWCAKNSGYYVCKYSGDRIAEVLEQTDEFDEEGRVNNRHDAITPGSGGSGTVSQEHVTFALSLKNLQSLFKATQPGEDIMYLLLSLMQILPDEKQLLPLLATVRSESFRRKNSARKGPERPQPRARSLRFHRHGDSYADAPPAVGAPPFVRLATAGSAGLSERYLGPQRLPPRRFASERPPAHL